MAFSAEIDPWLAGPLYENHPVSYSTGEGFFNFTTNSTTNRGFFDTSGNYVTAPRTSITTYNTDFGYGISKNSDFRVSNVLVRNLVSGASYTRLGDTLATLGYQVWRQKNSLYLPDLRVTIEETFPTGRWDNLNPGLYGADATGTGSFQTAIAMRLRKTIPLNDERFLALHARVALTHPSPVPINGFSIYGGGTLTEGTMRLGNSALVDLAAEYKFTQNWGATIEWFVFTQSATTFSGKISTDGFEGVVPKFRFAGGPSVGRRGKVLRRAVREKVGESIIFNNLMPSNLNLGKDLIGAGNNLSHNLAPCIEYNFSKDFALVGGFLFNFIGQNTPNFASAIVTLSKSWE